MPSGPNFPRWARLSRLLVPPIAFASGLGVPSFAEASPLPPVDFLPGEQVIVSGGLALFGLDGAVDFVVGDRLTLGLTGLGAAAIVPPFLGLGAARATYRIGGSEGFTWGLTLAAGYTYVAAPAVTVQTPWVQPAIDIAVPLASDSWKLRATIGPVIGFASSFWTLPGQLLWRAWPNLEFGYRIGRRSEITFLGGSLVGWRGTW